jgi:transcriptional regulator with XRE-family HTH domain
MPRPTLPPPLAPRQPKTLLGWTMQKLRMVHGDSVRTVASGFGCSASHISRVERGDTKPSRALVQFYEEKFEADGLLVSLFEVAAHANEQKRRRSRTGKQPKAIPGDATAFVDETVPQGTLFKPGEVFTKVWRIRNCGTVHWRGRRLERQGPLTGPGLITSPKYIDVPDTQPGAVVEIETLLKAPTYDATSIAYFKMVDQDGFLCFPDEHAAGLDVLVMVRRNVAGIQ